jgi:hypothetical protein
MEQFLGMKCTPYKVDIITRLRLGLGYVGMHWAFYTSWQLPHRRQDLAGAL